MPTIRPSDGSRWPVVVFIRLSPFLSSLLPPFYYALSSSRSLQYSILSSATVPRQAGSSIPSASLVCSGRHRLSWPFSTDQVDMRCRQPPLASSSDDCDGLDIESCFERMSKKRPTPIPIRQILISTSKDAMRQIWRGLLERTTPTHQSTTSIKRMTSTNPRMKMRTMTR